MSSAGFTEFIQPTTPPKSPSIPSVPNATPDDDSISSISFAPQLAIRSVPLPERESTIDYEHETPHSDDEIDEAPVGFVPNDPESRHYYPIYVPNPNYNNDGDDNKTMVAKFIQYSTDYTTVVGCNGRGYPQRTLPVTSGRKARVTRMLTSAQWRELRRGSPREFMVNEALADMGDPRMVGAVNRLRGKMEVDDTLETMLRDARHMVDRLTKEHRANQLELIEIQRDLQRANVYALVQDQFR